MPSLLIPVQMRFGDIDSYGHVNNVTMLQYLEDARVRLMRLPLPADAGPAAAAGPGTAQDGPAPEEPAADGTGQLSFRDLVGERLTVIGRQEAEYTEQLLWRAEPVFVRVWVSAVGGSSFVLDYAVQEEDGSRVYAVAQTVVVQIERSSGRPSRLDAAQRAALARWADEPTRFARRPAPAGE
ncbi:acyl-CoA thioesterase [Kocuria sp. LUK]|uniref:acyl-CoA thioesterase n=1 Tax=Kocuria sp. LUK TaxID=2897828 RepID=UPI001E553473|nr:thioesterase family protein [Kocuria sp. LUK]MCD1143641.1 acyl-CoA thioesterase [Kocuria sp. LUK]